MKKTLNLFILSFALVGSQYATAAAKKLLSNAPKAKPAATKTPRCKAEYCVKVVLSSALGAPGTLTVYKKGADKKYVEAGISCSAVGGNPNAWNDRAIYTPDGTMSVYRKTRYLEYNGEPSYEYEWASYFFKTGSINDVAIHTGSLGRNSHGCVRAPCAKQIYDLQGDVEVDVVYQN